MVMVDEMENCVKPALRKEWVEAQKEWFVQDESDPRQTRRPGLMKSEWRTTNGAIVA